MITIIPSILVKTADEFIAQISGLEDSVTIIQLDIADGDFVPNTTWADPEVVKNNCDLEIELHLMVSDPLEELKKWKEVEQVKRVLVHYESFACHSERAERVEESLSEAIQLLSQNDWDVGIVLNPDTSYEKIEKYLDKIQSVMFMGVVPGKQGQGLIPEVLENITNFTIDHPDTFTEVDGAVNEETLENIIKTGVKAICPGSAIFGNERTPEENVGRMKEIINKLT